MAISTVSVWLVSSTFCTTLSARSAAWDTLVTAAVPDTSATTWVRLASDVSLAASTCTTISAWKVLRKGLVGAVAFVELSVVLETAVAVAITVSCCCRVIVMRVSGFVSCAVTSPAVALVPLLLSARSEMSTAAPFCLTSVISPSTVVVSIVVLTLKSVVY